MSADALVEAVEAAEAGRNLSREQAASALGVIMAGEAEEQQTAALLLALRAKGETAEELAGMAGTMRSLASPVRPARGDLLDTCGTGGGRQTFNISTAAAFVAAGAGCAVAKHGNRTATGLTGSADVLEELGACLDLTAEDEAALIDETGFGFMFAPAHHAATRYVVPVRKALGVSTIFNLLGPLTNPAGARRQLIGVWEPSRLDIVADALVLLGVEHALVVSSADGLDEVGISGPTAVRRVRGGAVEHMEVLPEELGVERVPPDAVPGGGVKESAEIIRAVMAGESGPAREIVLLNAAAAIHAAGAAETLAEGLAAAAESIDTGAAGAVLATYAKRSQEMAA